LNCNEKYEISIKKGIFVDMWIFEKQLKCKNCGCVNSLRSENAYEVIMCAMKAGKLYDNNEDLLPPPPNTNYQHFK
jgi:hypothetical protein